MGKIVTKSWKIETTEDEKTNHVYTSTEPSSRSYSRYVTCLKLGYVRVTRASLLGTVNCVIPSESRRTSWGWCFAPRPWRSSGDLVWPRRRWAASRASGWAPRLGTCLLGFPPQKGPTEVVTGEREKIRHNGWHAMYCGARVFYGTYFVFTKTNKKMPLADNG